MPTDSSLARQLSRTQESHRTNETRELDAAIERATIELACSSDHALSEAASLLVEPRGHPESVPQQLEWSL